MHSVPPNAPPRCIQLRTHSRTTCQSTPHPLSYMRASHASSRFLIEPGKITCGRKLGPVSDRRPPSKADHSAEWQPCRGQVGLEGACAAYGCGATSARRRTRLVCFGRGSLGGREEAFGARGCRGLKPPWAQPRRWQPAAWCPCPPLRNMRRGRHQGWWPSSP